MKNGAATFVKHILYVLRSVAKAKSMAIKSKTDAIRARFIVFSLLRNKKLSISAVSNRIHALLGQQQETSTAADDDQGKAIVLYNAATVTPHHDHDDDNTNNIMELDTSCYAYHYDNDDDDKYPDLTHSLFDDDELDLGGPNASVIDLVRNSKEEGQNFSLEDEIDHVADLFIMKFHKNMRMQKLESFKRYQEMLQRSA